MTALKGRSTSLWAVLAALLPWALLCGLFAAVGVVHVTSRVMVVDAGYRLSRLEQENRTLQRDHDRRKLELATLKSPSKLEAEARHRLGMAPPPAGAVLTVEAAPRARAAPALAVPRPRGGP